MNKITLSRDAPVLEILPAIAKHADIIVCGNDAEKALVAKGASRRSWIMAVQDDAVVGVMKPLDGVSGEEAIISAWAKRMAGSENWMSKMQGSIAGRVEIEFIDITKQSESPIKVTTLQGEPTLTVLRRPRYIEPNTISNSSGPHSRVFCASLYKEPMLEVLHPHKKPLEMYVDGLARSVEKLWSQSHLPGYTNVIVFCDQESADQIINMVPDAGIVLVSEQMGFSFHQQYWRYFGAFLPANVHMHFRGLDNLASESSLMAAARFESSGLDIYASPYHCRTSYRWANEVSRLVRGGVVSMRGSCSIGPRAKRWMREAIINKRVMIGDGPSDTLAAKFHTDEVWLSSSLESSPENLSIMFDLDRRMPTKWIEWAMSLRASGSAECRICVGQKKLMARDNIV